MTRHLPVGGDGGGRLSQLELHFRRLADVGPQGGEVADQLGVLGPGAIGLSPGSSTTSLEGSE